MPKPVGTSSRAWHRAYAGDHIPTYRARPDPNEYYLVEETLNGIRDVVRVTFFTFDGVWHCHDCGGDCPHIVHARAVQYERSRTP